MPVSSLSSDDSNNDRNQHENNLGDNKGYPVSFTNDESTVVNLLVEGFAQEEETGEETSYEKYNEIKSSHSLKRYSVKGNKTLKQCSSSVAPNLKAIMKTTSIKRNKTRSEKQRSAMTRASAYDLYQSLISNLKEI
ncbi:hypothetical protein OUZ56_005526 [Daphnia magna]|uniref:Uncharacterized protein n=1 Tax=Daphnia magna TaxID=35525 RepID=A0ABQ9YT09_9CRUS|nr:hypothetical protein OUZ56_005526 [Daphnia magna]